MSSIPLVATTVNTQQPSPLDQYAKILGIKNEQAQQALIPGQLQQQQQQLTAGSQENQQRQIALQDQQAVTAAMKQWDGNDINELPSIVLKQGGSANAVFGLKNQIMQYQTALQKLTTDQLDNEGKKNDAIAGHIDVVKGLPAEQQPAAFEAAKQDLIQKGYMTPQQAQGLQYQGPDQLDTLEKMYMGHSQLVDQAAKAATASKDTAQAAAANAEANLNTLKAKMITGSKPGDFDQQIDQLIPANDLLNQQTKVLVNGSLQRGDYDSAQKAMEHAGNVLAERANTVVVQNHEDYRQALNRQAEQSNQLQKNGLEQLDKIFTDPQHGYTQFLAQSNATKADLENAKNGNELASSLAPLMTVLGVNSFAGIHRINPVEYQSAGPQLGSIYRRVNALLDKAGTGTVQPDTLKEMNGIVDDLIATKHASLIPAAQMVAQNAGLDPAKTVIMGQDGKMDTLANVASKNSQGTLSAPQGGGQQSSSGGAPPKPPNATHIGIGSVDKKKHYLDAGGHDLGLAE